MNPPITPIYTDGLIRSKASNTGPSITKKLGLIGEIGEIGEIGVIGGRISS